jgi:hypothetical protein
MDSNQEAGFARNGRRWKDFLLQWEVLDYLGNVGDTKVIKLGKMFNAYLVRDQGRKEGRV